MAALPACFGLPALGILLNGSNVVRAFKAAIAARGKYNVQLPALDAPADASEEDRDAYRRYVRCATNQVEWFSVSTALTIVSAATSYSALSDFGYADYGPRVVGVLSLLYAYFRKMYISGYQESPKGRVTSWNYSKKVLYAQVAIAGVCTAYLVFKDAVVVKDTVIALIQK